MSPPWIFYFLNWKINALDPKKPASKSIFFVCTKQINEPVCLFLKLFTLLCRGITKREYTKMSVSFIFLLYKSQYKGKYLTHPTQWDLVRN